MKLNAATFFNVVFIIVVLSIMPITIGSIYLSNWWEIKGTLVISSAPSVILSPIDATARIVGGGVILVSEDAARRKEGLLKNKQELESMLAQMHSVYSNAISNSEELRSSARLLQSRIYNSPITTSQDKLAILQSSTSAKALEDRALADMQRDMSVVKIKLLDIDMELLGLEKELAHIGAVFWGLPLIKDGTFVLRGQELVQVYTSPQRVFIYVEPEYLEYFAVGEHLDSVDATIVSISSEKLAGRAMIRLELSGYTRHNIEGMELPIVAKRKF